MMAHADAVLDYGEIRGAIYDAKTGKSITRATVSTIPPTASITTDKDGSYVFENVPPGNYRVMAQKYDYHSYEATIAVRKNEVTIANVQLPPKTPDSSVSNIAPVANYSVVFDRHGHDIFKGLVNIALGKPTTASREWKHSTKAAFAVDGEIVGEGHHWDAGKFPPAWIEIDLGADYRIHGVELIVVQTPAGYAEHEVYGRSMHSDEWILLKKFDGSFRDLQHLIFKANRVTKKKARYIRVITQKSKSWVGWREIMVFSNP
jgi:hypothetical protein